MILRHAHRPNYSELLPSSLYEAILQRVYTAGKRPANPSYAIPLRQGTQFQKI